MAPQNVIRRQRPMLYFRASAQLAILGLASVVMIPIVAASLALVVIWIGIPLLAVSLAIVRALSMSQRRLAARLLGHQAVSPYRPVPDGVGLVNSLTIRLTDPATYRDLVWLLVAGTLGLAAGITCLAFYIVLPLGLFASNFIVQTVVTIGTFVLRRNESEEMAERIGELAATRAETVDAQAAELRRIERDLHDGAQARLVALGMNLGLAEQLLATDPAAAQELITESRQSASTALADLRSLVRGILPPVLADRGLVAGLEALALASPIKIETDLVLVGRVPAPVESAMYFSVSEALTNMAKHSGAASGWMWLRYNNGRLAVSVGDTGIGGAALHSGGGLHGIERRLAAFDGTVTVASPLGGPTIITLELPCELSSERT